MDSMFASNDEHPIFHRTCKAMQGGRRFGFGEHVFGKPLAGEFSVNIQLC